MVKAFIILFLLNGVSLASLSENQKGAAAKAQLQEMSAALIKGDIDAFVAFINPSFLEAMGGKDSVIKQMKGSAKQVIASIKSTAVAMPSRIFRVKNQLQCLISDTVRSAFDAGPGYLLENIIAISEDEGIHWSFINAGPSYESYMQDKPYLPKLA